MITEFLEISKNKNSKDILYKANKVIIEMLTSQFPGSKR